MFPRCSLDVPNTVTLPEHSANIARILHAGWERLLFANQTKLEDFHEFLRLQIEIIIKNVYATKECTYKNLKNLIENKDPLLISGDKESCLVILRRSAYEKKL